MNHSDLAAFSARVVEFPGDCHVWIRADNGVGYGVLRVGEPGSRRPTLAHRASYEHYVGPIPDGLLVCHKCDNPGCVNPEHLFVGTYGDNARDMWSKDRHARNPPADGGAALLKWQRANPDKVPRGERHYKAKLTAEQVSEVRAALQRGVPGKRLAQDYGVSKATISYIKNGKRRARG